MKKFILRSFYFLVLFYFACAMAEESACYKSLQELATKKQDTEKTSPQATPKHFETERQDMNRHQGMNEFVIKEQEEKANLNHRISLINNPTADFRAKWKVFLELVDQPVSKAKHITESFQKIFSEASEEEKIQMMKEVMRWNSLSHNDKRAKALRSLFVHLSKEMYYFLEPRSKWKKSLNWDLKNSEGDKIIVSAFWNIFEYSDTGFLTFYRLVDLGADPADIRGGMLASLTEETLSNKAGKETYKELLNFLVKNKSVDFNSKDKEGITPLHFMAEWNDLAGLRFLLKQKVDTSIRDNKGNTPLHVSVENWSQKNSFSFAKLLLDSGADPNAVNTAGESVLDKVLYPSYFLDKTKAQRKRARIKKLLRDHGAKTN